ncbi:aminotransferase class III-fold pyridoxal phosphate-dependent enzyme [Seonamhaeicola maritimus]|uniref:Aminotransferase class III-fold pyridoxal phosphate-dependent enzyme n=1 Tax=Seonamhaeicola maritimus TaxID=2591822 RepID=A0A5C7GK21_9FLAO|nr:aminotransferase class III-fold pyridoxal phosphate-dependent enzyme [Seonamhaeicola maritimus]TXG38670.1 aminotransferase class III-fold pyridoxal phosphate-dependent enzyme [Seonamhaeicola maritimus]
MGDDIKTIYKDFSKPLISELIGALKLDKVYHRAQGDFVYYFNKEKEVKVLDLTGGYGSLLLGHNNFELREYIKSLYDQEVPVHTQLSVRSGSALLSKKIGNLISSKSGKKYYCTFLNSGSEAIEAAIKHAFLSFNKNLNAFFEEQELAFLNIKNFYNAQKDSIQLNYNDKNYNSFEGLKKDIEASNSHKIKHYEKCVLASKGSYHGKTLGALSITNNIKYKNPFFQTSPISTKFFEWDLENIKNHISVNSFILEIPKLNAKGKLLIKHKKMNAITAIIIEPILGESGIHVAPETLLKNLKTEAEKNGIPLIFDEIQCGFYRTGEFLSSFKSKVFADYYVMGKSLGGGLAKISALVINTDAYIPEFEMKHTSTFSDDDISSLIALKAIDIAVDQKKNIINSGIYIRQALRKIKTKYADIITDIRGDGLMIGISFKDFDLSQCYGLQSLSRSDYFGYMLSSYLLNKEHIRASVTLSNSKTIRIHPSAFISKSSIDYFISAIDTLCYILQCNDFYALISPVLEEKHQNLRAIKQFDVGTIQLDDDSHSLTNVGFLVHYINLGSIKQCIPSLDGLPNGVISDFALKCTRFGAPVLLGRNEIRNLYGEKITITFVGVPFISKTIKEQLNRSRHYLKYYQDTCSKAINFLYKMGITTIGLGQFTSIIMQNGRAVNNSKLNITTGNSFTVYSALKQVHMEIRERKKAFTKIAVIGAGGNIATVLSILLLDHCDSLLLVGNFKNSENKTIGHAELLLKQLLSDLLNKTSVQLGKLHKRFLGSTLLKKAKADSTFLNSGKLCELYNMEFSKKDAPVKMSCNLKDLKECDIAVVATNQGEPFLKTEHFKAGSLVCDISVPSNCTDELLNNQDIKTKKGGIVQLPNNEDLHPKGLPIESGEAFACMCETMLLGFEQSKTSYSYGSLKISQVQDIGKLGEKHGFKHLKTLPSTTLNL